MNSSTDKKLALTTANGKRQCYVEVERSTVKGAILWAKIPSISHTTDTILYLYYDPNAPDNDGYVGDVGSTPAQNVWDSNYKLVCHMVDDPDTSHVKDSTSNGNDGTKLGANEPIEITGKIGKAQDFDGADDRIDVPNHASLNPTSAIMLECWFNAQDVTQTHVLISKYFTNYALELHSPTAGLYRIRGRFVTAGGISYQTQSDKVVGAGLHYLVYRYPSKKVYLDGVDVTSEQATPAQAQDQTKDLAIGCRAVTFNLHSEGVIDEARISIDNERSVAWVGASYKTQTNTLIAYGDIENREASFPKPPQAPRPPINIGLFYRLKDWLAQKVAEPS